MEGTDCLASLARHISCDLHDRAQLIARPSALDLQSRVPQPTAGASVSLCHGVPPAATSVDIPPAHKDWKGADVAPDASHGKVPSHAVDSVMLLLAVVLWALAPTWPIMVSMALYTAAIVLRWAEDLPEKPLYVAYWILVALGDGFMLAGEVTIVWDASPNPYWSSTNNMGLEAQSVNGSHA